MPQPTAIRSSSSPASGWFPTDTDELQDAYAVSVGGGLLSQQASPPPCDLNAGACEGPSSSEPPSTGAGSAAFVGPGNQKAQKPALKRCPKGKRKVRRGGKVRCVPLKGKKQPKKSNRNPGGPK